MNSKRMSLVALAILFAVDFSFAQTSDGNASKSQSAGPNSAGIAGRLSSDQMKAVISAADQEKRQAFSDLVQQTSGVARALLSIQENLHRQFPRMGGTDNCRQATSDLQNRLGGSLVPRQIDDIVELNKSLVVCTGQYYGFAPKDSKEISTSANRAIAGEREREKQIENAKNMILQVEAALDAGDLIRANQLFRGLAGAPSQPAFAQSYLQQTQTMRQDLDKRELQQAAVAQEQSNRTQVEARQGQASAIAGKQNPAANSADKRPDNSTPPQSMVDTVLQGVEGMCHANKDCIDQYVASEQFRPFQFLVGHDASDSTDFGWLTEFKLPENGHTCEEEGNCLVVFVTPWVGKDGVESAKQLKKGWWIALQYRGTLQSLSSAGAGTKLNLEYSANALTLNGHTWQFDNSSGFYNDSTQPTISSTGAIIVEFSKEATDGYFAVAHPVGAQEGLGFILYCKVVNSELWWTNTGKPVAWEDFKADQHRDPSCKLLKQGKKYWTSPLPFSPELNVVSFNGSDYELLNAKVAGTLKVSESSADTATAVKYSVLDEGDLTQRLLGVERDTLAEQAKAQEEQKARAAFRAAPSPDKNMKPITVMVEKSYLNTDIASGSPLGLWAEVRISSDDAKRLHDPVGVPKNLAWHLVPELADGRLRFAIICNPNRKDCFRLNPGKTYTLELMNQYDSAGARGNLDQRFVRVNDVGVYLVADYGSQAE